MIAILWLSCATIQAILKGSEVRKPEVKIEQVRLADLSFEDVTLLFDMAVENPNAIGVTLTGYDYELLVQDNSFLSGKEERRVEIAARGESHIELPLTLRFSDLLQTYESLRDRDSLQYQLQSTLQFDLPVIGTRGVEISKSGQLPIIRLPRIQVNNIRVQDLSFSGADIVLEMQVQNPNAFLFDLNKINYALEINGERWFSGQTDAKQNIPQKQEALVRLPVKVDFARIGQSVFQVLQNKNEVNYRLSGQLDLSTSLPLLDKAVIPFEQSGKNAIQ